MRIMWTPWLRPTQRLANSMKRSLIRSKRCRTTGWTRQNSTTCRRDERCTRNTSAIAGSTFADVSPLCRDFRASEERGVLVDHQPGRFDIALQSATCLKFAAFGGKNVALDRPADLD